MIFPVFPKDIASQPAGQSEAEVAQRLKKPKEATKSGLNQESFNKAADEFEASGGDLSKPDQQERFMQALKNMQASAPQVFMPSMPPQLSRDDIYTAQGDINTAFQDYFAASQYDPLEFENKIRGRLQGTKDLDEDMDRLWQKRYQLRPKLLKELEGVIDPNKKEEIIRIEESMYDDQITDLLRLKTERGGFLKDYVGNEMKKMEMRVDALRMRYQKAQDDYGRVVADYKDRKADVRDVWEASEKYRKAQIEAKNASRSWNIGKWNSPAGGDGWQSLITQDYGAKSPLAVDNVKLADGRVGTPGIDIDGKIGDPIYTTTEGEVVEVRQNGGYGLQVIVADREGNLHMYNHLSGAGVNKGDFVSKGRYIGAMGNSGSVFKGPNGDGSHLDYRVKNPAGQWVDPKVYIGQSLDPKKLDAAIDISELSAELGGTVEEREQWERILTAVYETTGSLEEVKKKVKEARSQSGNRSVVSTGAPGGSFQLGRGNAAPISLDE